MLKSSGEESINLNNIEHPKFNPAQVLFFKQMIQLLRQDRLNLEPREDDYDRYKLSWNSLISMEEVYRWLINSNDAVLAAEREERVEGAQYDPQQLLAGINDDTDGVDLNNLTF